MVNIMNINEMSKYLNNYFLNYSLKTKRYIIAK